MKTKILLDTDIGSDIDDAVCLAYLLANPQCELLGITTVTGEAHRRARLASALCRAAGKDIPIYPGVEQPLLVAPRQPHASQAAALEKWPHRADFPEGEGIRFLRDTIRANPGEVILLTIGPLTNAALLFALYPEIPALLKGMTLMCGLFASEQDEIRMDWNGVLDPHATAIVYRRAPAGQRSVGLDVTLQVTMEAQQVRRRFRSPLLKPVLDFAEIWFEENQDITFHDPLAATTIFDPGICRFERGDVEVELNDPRRLGHVRFTPNPAGARQVALAVQPERFFEHFFSVFE